MIQDSVNKVIYAGNGLATEFAYPFEITKNTDVKVMTVSPNGVETVLANDYYVDVERSTVVYPGWVAGETPANSANFAPLADGWKLVIYRQVEYTQEVAMFDQHPFKAIEQMIDKVTILIQQLKDETERAMRLGISVDNADVNMTIPYAAGKSFRWSDDGKSLVVTKDPARVEESVQGWLGETERQASVAAEKANAAEASEIAAKASEQRAQEIADSIVDNIDKAETNAQAAAESANEAAASAASIEGDVEAAAAYASEANTAAALSNQKATEANNAAGIANEKAQEATNASNAAKVSENAAKAYTEQAEENARIAENAKNETFDGNWKANEEVKIGDIRFLGGRENVGYVLECIQAGVTGATQPTFTEDDVEPEPFIEAVNVYATASYINKE